MSLAYANRSSCFLKLQLYERYLVDIQLAKAADYPKRLMSEPSEPMLSFNAHEKWSCMANVLEIEKNDQFGRLVRAKGDLKIGQTILMEETYIQMERNEIDAIIVSRK